MVRHVHILVLSTGGRAGGGRRREVVLASAWTAGAGRRRAWNRGRTAATRARADRGAARTGPTAHAATSRSYAHTRRARPGGASGAAAGDGRDPVQRAGHPRGHVGYGGGRSRPRGSAGSSARRDLRTADDGAARAAAEDSCRSRGANEGAARPPSSAGA